MMKSIILSKLTELSELKTWEFLQINGLSVPYWDFKVPFVLIFATEIANEKCFNAKV